MQILRQLSVLVICGLKMNKYLVTIISTFIIECASTMYISTVSSKSIWMIFWAFIGPFLSLPFVGYMVETKNWNDRLKLAFSSAFGYAIGATLIYII